MSIRKINEKGVFMKTCFILLSSIFIVFLLSCNINNIPIEQNESELMVEAIYQGSLYDEFGEVVIDEDLKKRIIDYLNDEWRSLKVEEGFDEIRKTPSNETHFSPVEHTSCWFFDGIYEVYKLWEQPPVVVIYKVYGCSWSGCRVIKMEYVGEIEP